MERLKSELNRLWDKGKTVVFDVDVVGGREFEKKIRGSGAGDFYSATFSGCVARSIRATGY